MPTYTINAYAKVNIFLKITGYEDGYHMLSSRFMKVQSLYDTIEFVPCECDTFTLEGFDDVPLESNTIYKAYKALNEHTGDLDIPEFFSHHKVVVTKRIPTQAGLGGGSSDAGAFMRLAHQVCDLKIDIDTLAGIGSKIGADVPFFVYDYSSANVKGYGDIVMPFEEEPIDIELFAPQDVSCDTAQVYKTFHKYLLKNIDPASHFGWENLDSRTLLRIVPDPAALNDLFPAAMMIYPKLEQYNMDGWFFSGSGSTFFRPTF
jgi:4-diphosphocytidyl-2-C-methyl-D-erythritol kinase